MPAPADDFQFSALYTTDPITYNLRDTGRKFTGQPRDFDTTLTADFLNSEPVQEMIGNGDLPGYLEHWPRNRWGMKPPSYVREGMDLLPLLPGVRTSYLKATRDGLVTHRQTFLDNAVGRACLQLYKSKQGGFSSVITVRRGPRGDVPVEFLGFDYVTAPNYNHNRPGSTAPTPLLDSADPQDALAFMAALPPDVQEQVFAVMDDAHARTFEMAVKVGERLEAARESHQPFVEKLTEQAQKIGRLEADLKILKTGRTPFSAKDFLGGAGDGTRLDSAAPRAGGGLFQEWRQFRDSDAAAAARAVVAEERRLLDAADAPPEPVAPTPAPVLRGGVFGGAGRPRPAP